MFKNFFKSNLAKTLLIVAFLVLMCILFSLFLNSCGNNNNSSENIKTNDYDNINILGAWRYVKSTESFGEDERLLSSNEVEILRDFEITPPKLEIKLDNTILADFITYENEATLVQTSTYSFDIIPKQPSEYHSDLYDILTYDSKTGMLRYTWNLAGIHHYFIKENITKDIYENMAFDLYIKFLYAINDSSEENDKTLKSIMEPEYYNAYIKYKNGDTLDEFYSYKMSQISFFAGYLIKIDEIQFSHTDYLHFTQENGSVEVVLRGGVTVLKESNKDGVPGIYENQFRVVADFIYSKNKLLLVGFSLEQ